MTSSGATPGNQTNALAIPQALHLRPGGKQCLRRGRIVESEWQKGVDFSQLRKQTSNGLLKKSIRGPFQACKTKMKFSSSSQAVFDSLPNSLQNHTVRYGERLSFPMQTRLDSTREGCRAPRLNPLGRVRDAKIADCYVGVELLKNCNINNIKNTVLNSPCAFSTTAQQPSSSLIFFRKQRMDTRWGPGGLLPARSSAFSRGGRSG